MADLAIGVSKTALDALVNKIKAAIKEDEEKWQTVQRDVVFIKEEFEMMQAFLDTTNGEGIKNKVVKTWVRQVRDLSYDTEDCIEFVVHLDTKQSWWLRLLPSCMVAGAALALDEAVAEIKLLKARVEDVSLRRMRYDLIGDSDSRSVEHMEKTLADSSRDLDIFVEAREADKDQVAFSQLKFSIATADKNLGVLSVCGKGGDIGTTSIIRKVYEDSEICSEFKCRAWVKLVVPFSSHEFIRNLIDQFYTNSHWKPGLAVSGTDVVARMHEPADTFVNEVVEQVNTHRYFIVLEGVSSMPQWDAVRAYLPDMKNGSRIIVSTHQLEIASLCVGQPYEVSEMRRFSANHTVCLFLKDNQHDNLDFLGTKRDNGYNSAAKKLEDRITSGCSTSRAHVIPVFGEAGDGKSSVVRIVYDSCKLKDKFDKFAWVNVSQQFSIEVFCQTLYAELCSSLDKSNHTIRKCQDILHQYRCLVVIDGLESETHWDSIKASLPFEISISCFIVVTSKKNVARYCARNSGPDCTVIDDSMHFFEEKSVQDHNESKTSERPPFLGTASQWLKNFRLRYFSEEKGTNDYKESRTSRHPSLLENASQWLDEYNESRTSGHPVLLKPASQWLKNFRLRGRDFDIEALEQKINSASRSGAHHVVSVWGNSGVGKSALVRTVFYRSIVNKAFEKYAWVDAPGRDSSVSLSKTLFLEVRPGEAEYYHAAECHRLLGHHRWLVVIDHLENKGDWQVTNSNFSLRNRSTCILVVTRDENLARYCATKDDEVYHVKDLNTDAAYDLSKGKGIQEDHVPASHSILCSTSEHPRLQETATRWLKNVCLHGRDMEMKLLEQHINLVGNTGMNHVASVWGTAGVGKSVLVRTVFYRCMVEATFQKYAWVHAPQHCSLEFFCYNICRELGMPDVKTVKGCLDLLHHFHCLVVIDRLELKGVWELIKAKLSLGTSRSCIIVISRDQSVARHCAKTDEAVFHVKDLESDAALVLLKGKEGGEAGASNWDHETTEEAKHFIKNYGKLHKEGANALRSYLESQAEMKQVMKHLNANFIHELEIKPELRQLQDSLAQTHSSFRICPQIIKKRTFYLAIFEDSMIRQSRLVRRWIAEGYTEGSHSNSLVEYDEKLFYKLVELSIMGRPPHISGVAEDMRTSFWEVYSLVLKYIIARETEESILLPLEISVLEGESDLKTEHVGQHLAVRSSWKREEYVFDRLDFSRLRSLTVSGEWQAFFIVDKMRVLRVLDLEGTFNVMDRDLEQIGTMLPRLKFLSLRGCKEVSRLPDSLGNLRQLQTLDIRGTKVVKLPPSIVKLHKLQYIRARTNTRVPRADNDSDQSRLCTSSGKDQRQGRLVGDHSGVKVPRGIGRLTNLLYLGVVDVTTSGGEAILAELHNLKQLKNLHVSGVLQTNRINMFWNFPCQSWNIRFPQNIMKLIVEMQNFCLSREYIQVIGKLQKMHTLRLRVNDIQGGLPKFSRYMQERDDAGTSSAHPFGQLKVIEIVCTNTLCANFYEGARFQQPKLSLEVIRYLTPQDIQDLGSLKRQHTLCLRFLGNNNTLLLESPREQQTTFDELKMLEISFSSKFEMKFDARMMKDVEQLKFDCLDASILQLSGLEHLLSLKEVCLKGSYKSELAEDLLRKLGNHENQFVLKQE